MRWRLSSAGFGLVVVEHGDAFHLPHVPLPVPEPEPQVEEISLVELALRTLGYQTAPTPKRTAAVAPSTPAAVRTAKAAEAARTPQPFEWASSVYVTVYGEVRWRCCGNLFDEAHSPYCASPGDLL